MAPFLSSKNKLGHNLPECPTMVNRIPNKKSRNDNFKASLKKQC